MTRAVAWWACVGVLAWAAGCATSEGDSSDAASGTALFPVERLDGLDLSAVRAAFSEGERVSIERFNPAVDNEEGFAGGVYAYGGGCSISVRVYASERAAMAALLSVHRATRRQFIEGRPSPKFARQWWYQEGPPASVLFADRNVVVQLHTVKIAPDAIAKRGADAAAAVEAQLWKPRRE